MLIEHCSKSQSASARCHQCTSVAIIQEDEAEALERGAPLCSIARMKQKRRIIVVVEIDATFKLDTAATHPPPGLVRLVADHGRVHERETQSMCEDR